MSTLSGPDPEAPLPPPDVPPALTDQEIELALQDDEESDHEAEADVKSKAVVKSGMLTKSQTLGTSHLRYFEIRGTDLFWFIETQTDTSNWNANFRGKLCLKGFTLKLADGKKPELTLNPPPKSTDKSISLKGTLEELQGWQTALQTAITTAESVDIVVKAKSSLAQRWKKGLAQKITTAAAQQNAMMPPAVAMIINCLGRIVIGFSKDETKGKEIINNMIKMVTKLYFILDDGKATMHDLAPMDKHLRGGLQLLANFWSPFKRKAAKGVPQLTAEEMAQQASAKLVDLNNAFCSFMQQFVSDKSVATISYTLGYLSQPAILLYATKEESLADVRVTCASEIDNYLAFESWDESV